MSMVFIYIYGCNTSIIFGIFYLELHAVIMTVFFHHSFVNTDVLYYIYLIANTFVIVCTIYTV